MDLSDSAHFPDIGEYTTDLDAFPALKGHYEYLSELDEFSAEHTWTIIVAHPAATVQNALPPVALMWQPGTGFLRCPLTLLVTDNCFFVDYDPGRYHHSFLVELLRINSRVRCFTLLSTSGIESFCELHAQKESNFSLPPAHVVDWTVGPVAVQVVIASSRPLNQAGLTSEKIAFIYTLLYEMDNEIKADFCPEIICLLQTLADHYRLSATNFACMMHIRMLDGGLSPQPLLDAIACLPLRTYLDHPQLFSPTAGLTKVLIGGDATPSEVPRKVDYRLKLLKSAQAYLDLTDAQVQQLSTTRHWSPELIHGLKHALCPENVACLNLMFNQDFPQMAPAYNSPLKLAPHHHDKIPVHLPPEHPLYIDECILQPNPPGEHKEYLHPSYGWTEQFKTARPFQSLFPSHQNNDYATRKWSIEYRLRFTQAATNVRRLHSTERKSLGSSLFVNFVRYIGLPAKVFNEDEFFDCVTENTHNRLKKPLHNLFNIRERGDLGNNYDFIDLFLKSQICKKLEKLYSKAKAGQMIVNFHVAIIVLFGPVVRYIHRQVERAIAAGGQPLYLHGGRSTEDLNAFVAEFLDPDIDSTTNDFTMFDQSQDVEFLNFQVLLMQHLSIPIFFIEFYVNYKTNLQSKYGPLAVMIFSGEPCTWHFNSYDNIAWHCTIFIIPRSMPAMISGDDSLFNGLLIERSDTKGLRRLFTLQAKTEITRVPVFCGWICTGRLGVVKHPQLVYIRVKIAAERGNLADVIQSYAEEAQYAYALGHDLLRVLDPFNLSVQQALNRFFTKNLPLLAPGNRYHK